VSPSDPPPLIVDKLFDPSSSAFSKCPYDAYAVSRGTMPVAYHEGFGEWIVTGSSQIQAILRDHHRFTSRHNLEGSYPFTPECMALLDKSLFFQGAIYNTDPPLHTRFRALVGQYFSPRKLDALKPFILDTARELAAGMGSSGGGDAVADFATVLPLRVTYHMIGIPRADQAIVKAWDSAWLALQVVPLSPEQQLACAESLISYESYLRDLLNRRAADTDPVDDITTGLAKATLGDSPLCTLDQAIVATRFMIAASHETTSGLISNALYRLLEHRELWEAVVRNPRLAENAVEEALRFDSPAQGALRVTTERVRVGDVDMPEGSRLRVMLAAVGRDPATVGQPDTFRLDRDNPPVHTGFGAGSHFCAGAALARLETRLALQALAEVAPDLCLEPGFEPQYLPGAFIFHSLTALQVKTSQPALASQNR
jgi:cytochrome P450